MLKRCGLTALKIVYPLATVRWQKIQLKRGRLTLLLLNRRGRLWTPAKRYRQTTSLPITYSNSLFSLEGKTVILVDTPPRHLLAEGRHLGNQVLQNTFINAWDKQQTATETYRLRRSVCVGQSP